MNHRSLLDYLTENVNSEQTDPAEDATQALHRRLAEIEARLTAALRHQEPVSPEPAFSPQEPAFSSQIEHILRREQQHRQQKRMDDLSRPAPRRHARIEMQPPPLASELPVELPQRSAEFTKFVEAVHLIGQAAQRFLHAPESFRQAPAPRENPGPSQDTLQLTAALKETIAAFQSMTSDLASAAGEIRRAAETPRSEIRQSRPPAEPAPPARRGGREDEEYFRLQDDLEDLRARLSAVARRRPRDGY